MASLKGKHEHILPSVMFLVLLVEHDMGNVELAQQMDGCRVTTCTCVILVPSVPLLHAFVLVSSSCGVEGCK
eukprot:3639854-Amphidinium_carterae.2